MSSGLDLRKRVVRRDPPKTRGGKGKEDPSPLSAIDAGSPGEIKISNDTLYALNHLYHASPSIQAARTILVSQLLSSGCVVRRDGRDVPLKDTFARHLHDVWVPFAKKVIDHFLQFGFVVVSLEEEAPPPFANFIKGKAMAAQSEMGPAANGDDNRRKDPPDQSQLRAQKRPIAASSDQKLRTPKRGAGVAGRPRPPTSCPSCPTSASASSPSSTWASPTTAGSTASSRPTPTPSTNKTSRPRSSFGTSPTRRATSARPSPPSSSRPPSSRRSRSWRSRRRSCARARCS